MILGFLEEILFIFGVKFRITSKIKAVAKPFRLKIMKKIFIALAIVLFTINVGAQESKTNAKATPKKESCCAKKETCTKKMTAEEMKKCSAKSKSEAKSCCAKK